LAGNGDGCCHPELMTTWFTADLHLGHRNILTYCNRPFADADAMNHALVEQWNAAVATDDTVWVPGDYAMGPIERTLPLTQLLNGHKILVPGNHDYCWAGHRDLFDEWTERYVDAGFAEVRQGPVVTTVAGTEVSLCHFPYVGDSHGRDRFVSHRPIDVGGWLLHGHVHDTWAQQGRMINVGVDVAGYAPVPAETVANAIAAGPAVRDRW